MEGMAAEVEAEAQTVKAEVEVRRHATSVVHSRSNPGLLGTVYTLRIHYRHRIRHDSSTIGRYPRGSTCLGRLASSLTLPECMGRANGAKMAAEVGAAAKVAEVAKMAEMAAIEVAAGKVAAAGVAAEVSGQAPTAEGHIRVQNPSVTAVEAILAKRAVENHGATAIVRISTILANAILREQHFAEEMTDASRHSDEAGAAWPRSNGSEAGIAQTERKRRTARKSVNRLTKL